MLKIILIARCRRKKKIMRRVSSNQTIKYVASCAAARGVYSIWGSVVLETPIAQNKTWLERITSQSAYRSFSMGHIPESSTPSEEARAALSNTETYLLSAIEDDITRMMAVDWTFDFDPFWRDRVQQHVDTFSILYQPGKGIAKMMFGNQQHNAVGRNLIEPKLNRLKAILSCAEETERRFSAIANARFHMQREVFDGLEREKILAGCVDIVEEFKQIVPEDFKRKAVGELDNHLMNMRHWIWDCPNAKRTYPRRLA